MKTAETFEKLVDAQLALYNQFGEISQDVERVINRYLNSEIGAFAPPDEWYIEEHTGNVLVRTKPDVDGKVKQIIMPKYFFTDTEYAFEVLEQEQEERERKQKEEKLEELRNLFEAMVESDLGEADVTNMHNALKGLSSEKIEKGEEGGLDIKGFTKNNEVIEVDYHVLERYIEEHTGLEYEIVAYEEASNDSTLSTNVTCRVDDCVEEMIQTNKPKHYSLGKILDYLCYQEKLEAGKYLIDICW